MKKTIINKAIEIISSGKKQAQEALKDNKISKDEYNNYMKQLNKALDKAPKKKSGGRLSDGTAFIKSLYKDKL
jgi:hypothetical protein|tara:strand:+ start:47 stop:265 length:219 start_codon:yes stop_codon:yes gene_type:complete